MIDSISALTGEGDYFYLVDKKEDYTVYDNIGSCTSCLFNSNMASDDMIPVASLPWVLNISKAGTITATDVLQLLIIPHRLSGSSTGSYNFHNWTVEVLNTSDVWNTVLNRSGVNDYGLIAVPLHIGSGYEYIKGIRITVYNSSECSWSPGNFAVAAIQLRDFRPSFTPANAIGALDQAGGNIYGGVNLATYSGNVGIGTSSPNYLLEVADGTENAVNLSGVLYVNDTSGRVGIGTESPQKELEVVGDVNVTGSLLFYGEIIPDGATCGDGKILKKTGTNDWDCADDDSGGDITDVLAGYGITVDNSGGPQPRVNLSSSAAGAGLTYTIGVLAVGDGEGVNVGAYSVTFDCSEVTDSANDGLSCNGENLVVGAGNGLSASDTGLDIELYTGSGLIADSTGLSMNRSCTDGQVMKWETTGSYWYCATDENSGGTVTGTGSANRAAFWTGSSTLSYDGNFTWDNTNKRLGIGTTSPQNKLNVIGDINATTNITTPKLCLNGDCQTSWPSGLGGFGWLNSST